MVDNILKITLLFTPIAYCCGVNYYKFELVFFQVFSILLFTSSMFDTPKREFRLKRIIAIFLLVCLFSVVVNGFQTNSLSALINIFFACLNIYIITIYSKNLESCFNWLLVGLGINVLIYIGQRFGFHPIIDPSTLTGPNGAKIENEYGGVIGNAPRFAAFIALSLPFVNRLYMIPALILGFLLKEIAIFFTIAIIIYHRIKSIGWLFLFISVCIISILFLHKGIISSFNLRLPIWKDLITNLSQRPLLGFGIGNFKIADYACSSFLQWMYGVGMIGGIGVIAICLKRMKWYLSPLLFLCCFEYPFEIPRLYPVLVCILAYYGIEQKEEKIC